MKQFGIKFILSVACLLGAAALFYLAHPVIAAFLLWPAFMLNTLEIKSYASPYQLVNFRIQTVFLGYIIDSIVGQPFHLYMLASFMLSFTGVLRLELLKQWGFNKYTWSEGLALLSVYSLYLYAGVQHPSDWHGWVLPLLPMLFMTMIGSGIYKDGKLFNNESTTKIKAEAGQPAMDFTLPDSKGGSVSLSDFKNKNHVLLLFVRGDWCPTCHIMIRTYEKNREKFAEKDVITLGISPDTSEVNAEMIRRLSLQNILLTDSSQEVTRQYGGKFFANGIDSKYPDGIPLPASVLVDKNGVIRYVSTPGKANEFLDPNHIFPVVAQLN